MDSPAKSAILRVPFEGSLGEFESVSLPSIFVGPISILLNGEGYAVNAEKGGIDHIIESALYGSSRPRRTPTQ